MVRYKFFLFLCFFLVSINSIAQSSKTDSLQHIIEATNAPSDKINLLNDLAYIYYSQANYQQSIDALKKAINLSETNNHQDGLARSSGNLANVYAILGNYEFATELRFKSLNIYEESNDTLGIIRALNSLGNLYIAQGLMEQGLKALNKALNLSIIINDKKGEATSLNNLAAIYFEKEQFETALTLREKSLKIYYTLEDEKDIASTLNNLGTIYFKTGEYDKALEAYNEAYYIHEKHKSITSATITLINLSELFIKKNDIENAIIYAHKSLALSKETGVLLNISEASRILSEIYAITGNLKEELMYFKLYTQTKDSLLNENTTKQLAMMSAIYETEKKEKEIELLNKEKDKQTAVTYEQNKKKNLIIIAVISGLLIVIIFSAFLFNRFTITRKQKVIIEEKQKEITDSINFAKRIQTAILPPENYLKKHLPESFVMYQPKDIVSGDFYWLENVNGLVLFAAADCTGHGVSGAMVSVVCSNALNRTVKEFGIIDPGKILDKTRELVLETFAKSESGIKDGMDISLCVLNTKTNELKWSGANNPIYYISANSLNEIKGDKQPIGKIDNFKTFTTHNIQLQKSDTIYVFTDGYADQFGGPKEKKFMYKPLKNMLLDIHQEPLSTQKEHLQQHFANWKGNMEQTDDVLIIGLRI